MIQPLTRTSTIRKVHEIYSGEDLGALAISNAHTEQVYKQRRRELFWSGTATAAVNRGMK